MTLPTVELPVLSAFIEALVAAGTIGLALLTYHQLRIINRERRATQARELAEKVYNPILQELGELRPEYPFSLRQWSDIKKAVPHIIPRIPSQLYSLFEQAEAYAKLTGGLGNRVSELVTEREAQIVKELGLKPQNAGPDTVEYAIVVGKGELQRVYLSHMWITGKNFDTYARDFVTARNASGKEWDIELRVGGYRAGGKPEAEKVANLVFEILKADDRALQLQQRQQEAMELASRISKRIREELGKPLSPWIEQAKASMGDENPQRLQPQKVELERMKVQFFWDYHRTKVYSTLTMLVSLFIGILVILNALQIAGRISYQATVLIVYVLIVLYVPLFLINGVLVKDKQLILETDKLLGKLARVEPLGSLKELLKVEQPETFWVEYKRIFGFSKKQIFLITILLLGILVWGLLH